MTLTHFDFNAGIAGASLAAEWAGFTAVGFCEINPFCQAVLRKHWPEVPIFDDIRTITADDVRRAGIGRIDVAHFSPPCQGLSVAGKQQGEADPRYLWPDTIRVIAELRPTWVVIENVDNAVKLVLDVWLADLERLGYDAVAVVLPAAAVGAPHLRNRLFVVAHAAECAVDQRYDAPMQRGRTEPAQQVGLGSGGVESLAHAERSERERRGIAGVVGDTPPTDESEAWERERLRHTLGRSCSALADAEGECRQIRQASGERSGRLAGGNAPLGDAPEIRRERGGSTRHRRAGFESSNPAMEYTGGTGRQERDAASVAGSEGLTAWGCDEDGRLGQSQPGVDRDFDGLSTGLDGYRSHGLTWPGWPAGMGPYQHDYEPPRTGGNPRKRRLRLKALGNAIVPQQLYPLMAAIALSIEQGRGLER